MNNPSTTSANHDSSAYWSTVNDRSSATDSTTSSTTSSSTSSTTTSQSTTSTYNPDDGGGTIYTDSGNYNGNVVPSYESTESATNTDSSSTTNNYGTYGTPATKGNPNGQPNYQTVKTNNNINNYDSQATTDSSSNQSNYAKSSTSNDISRAVTIPGVGLVAPSGETITADEYIAARKQEAAEKIKQINDESARITHNQATISNELEDFKVNGSSLGSGTYGDDAKVSGPTELPSSPAAYDSIIKKINNDIKDSQKLMNDINEFNSKYSDLDINSDDLNKKNKEIKDHIGKASEKRDELVATRDKVDEVNQNLNNLFKDEVVEVYEDGSKSVTKGSTQYNYDADGNLLSTVERDKNGNILNIDATKSSALQNIKTQVFEDGSKTVTEGDVKRNYDADGKLLSTVKTTHEPGFTKTEIEAEEGSALKNSTIKVYDEDGSKTVIEDNVERNYDKEGNLLSTVETTKEPGMTKKKITTGEGSGLKDSVVKIYDEDGSKTVIEGNIQKNYDGNGNLLSTVETTKEPGATVTNIKTEVGSGLKDSVIKVYDDDGSKTVIEGNIQKNYDGNGKLLSTIETTKEPGVTITNIKTEVGSGLKDSVVKVYDEDGSKTVIEGNIQRNYDSNGKLLSTVETTKEPGITITNVKTEAGSGLKDSIVKEYTEDGSKSVVIGSMQYNYDNKGKLLSTVETNKNPSVTTTTIRTQSESGLKDSIVKEYTEDGSKTIIEGNKQYNYDREGRILSVVEADNEGLNIGLTKDSGLIKIVQDVKQEEPTNNPPKSNQHNTDKETPKKDDNIKEQESSEYKVDFTKYQDNPNNGFFSWMSDNKFTLDDLMKSDFAKSDYAKEHGYDTPEKLMEAFAAVVISESNKTPEDVLAIMSVIGNRCELYDNWKEDKGTTNPIDMVFAFRKNGSREFEAVSKIRPGTNEARYEAYIPSKYGENGIDEVNKILDAAQGNSNNKYTYEELRDVVYDAYFGGARNNLYSGYYSGWTGDGSPNATYDEGHGGNHYYNNVSNATEMNKLHNLEAQLDNYQKDYTLHNLSSSSYDTNSSGGKPIVTFDLGNGGSKGGIVSLQATNTPNNNGPRLVNTSHTTKTDNTTPTQSTSTPNNGQSKEFLPNSIGSILNNPEVKGNTDAEKLAYAYNKGFIERPDYKKAISNVDTFTGKYTGPADTIVTSSDKVAASQTNKAVASTVPPTNQPSTGKTSTTTTNTNTKPEVSTGTVTNTSSNKIADVLNNPEVKGNTDAEKLAYAYNKGFIERPDYKKAMSNVDTFTGKYNGPLGTEVSEEPVAQPPETKVTPPARTTPNPKPDSTKPSTNANAAAANQPQTNVESSNKPVEENKNMFSVRSSTIDSELEKELENAPTKYYEDGSYSKTIGNTKYSYDKEGNLLHTAETITENGVTITNIEATKDSKLESGIIRINNENGQKEIINNHTEKIYDGAGNKVYDLEKNNAGDYVKLDEYDPQNGNTRHIDFGKDANGNRIEKYIEERHDGNLLYTIEQDANGNINGQKYDTSGRVVEHQYMDSNAKTTTYTNYAYNNKGDKYEEAVSAYDSNGLLYSLQKNENGDIIDCSVAKQGSIPTNIEATYYKDGVKIDIEGGKKHYSYSQRYKFDDEGNIPEKEKINGSYLNGWDVDYYNEYASNWYDNHQKLKALGATAEDPHQCGYINLYEGAVTSERDGCSAFSTASVFATINGGTTVVDANGNKKEISPVEILALYPGKNSNTGEFMKVASDYYGFDYSTEISFSDDNNKYLKNLLKNGGGSVTAVDSSVNEKFAKGDKPAIHYVAVDDYYEDANGVGYFHVTDPFVNLENNPNNLELGQWYSENSVEWQNINNCHNYSAMVAPRTMSVEEACGYQQAS